MLAEVVPEERIVWRILNDGVNGTHGYYLTVNGERDDAQVPHRGYAHRYRWALAVAPPRRFVRAFNDGALRQGCARVLKR